MKVTLESTSKIVTLVKNGTEVYVRVWEGRTSAGVPCHAFITLIVADQDHDLSEFERDLTETATPSAEVQAIPLRMIL